MAVPDFQSLMLPTLRAVEDGQVHASSEIHDRVAAELKISDEDLAVMLPSGRAKLFYNRVAWALQYLTWGELLTRPKRARYAITDRGRQALGEDALSIKYLTQFPEFQAVAQRWGKAKPKPIGGGGDDDTVTLDPREAMESAHEELRLQLADEVLAQVKTCTPEFFEQLVVDLLVAMGYGGSVEDAAQAVGKSGDGGIDGRIKEDRLGFDTVYVQAKRWENPVGRPTVQAFAGALQGERANKGVLITTSGFTQEARHYVDKLTTKIVLIDGDQLAGLMIDFGIGVTQVATYSINRIDTDYFEGGVE